jgi:hypothetical protein
VVWAFAYLYPALGAAPVDVFPMSLLVIGTVWGLFETPIATVVGVWLYREEG